MVFEFFFFVWGRPALGYPDTKLVSGAKRKQIDADHQKFRSSASRCLKFVTIIIFSMLMVILVPVIDDDAYYDDHVGPCSEHVRRRTTMMSTMTTTMMSTMMTTRTSTDPTLVRRLHTAEGL